MIGTNGTKAQLVSVIQAKKNCNMLQFLHDLATINTRG